MFSNLHFHFFSHFVIIYYLFNMEHHIFPKHFFKWEMISSKNSTRYLSRKERRENYHVVP